MKTLTLIEDGVDSLSDSSQAFNSDCDSDCDTESDHGCDCYSGNG